MKRYSLAFALIVSFATGCGHHSAENVTPDQADDALRTALNSWKDGKTRADLESQRPSIIMNDPDLSSDNHLLEFKMGDAGRLEGRQMRWMVEIKLQDKNGKISNKKATYIIDTNPQIVIVRDPFASPVS
jgi:hypothetical protein